MSTEEALYAHVTNDPATSAIIGDRAYPVILPQEATLPALTYQLISAPPMGQTHDERSGPSLVKKRYQFNCYAFDYDTGIALKTAVRQSLRGFSGLLGGLQRISGASVITQQDDYDAVTQRFRAIVDVQFVTSED